MIKKTYKIIHEIVVDDSTKKGRLFDIIIQVLIILSLISFSLETLPELNNEIYDILQKIEVVCIYIFTIEYLLRIFLNNKKNYMFSFFGLIDLLAILPFYITSGIDLRSVRVFRILKIFRLFKLLKYTKSIDRMSDAFKKIKNELVIFFIAILFLLYVSAVGIYYFENPVQPEKFKSVFHSLWWSVTTLTTVGYGDMYPITIGGKIFSTFIVFIGLGLVAVPSGLLATAFTQGIKKSKD